MTTSPLYPKTPLDSQRLGVDGLNSLFPIGSKVDYFGTTYSVTGGAYRGKYCDPGSDLRTLFIRCGVSGLPPHCLTPIETPAVRTSKSYEVEISLLKAERDAALKSCDVYREERNRLSKQLCAIQAVLKK